MNIEYDNYMLKHGNILCTPTIVDGTREKKNNTWNDRDKAFYAENKSKCNEKLAEKLKCAHLSFEQINASA